MGNIHMLTKLAVFNNMTLINGEHSCLSVI